MSRWSHNAVLCLAQRIIDYHIQGGDHLVWLDDGETIRVVPTPADPLHALRGRGRGEGLTELLLAERARDRARETGS